MKEGSWRNNTVKRLIIVGLIGVAIGAGCRLKAQQAQLSGQLASQQVEINQLQQQDVILANMLEDQQNDNATLTKQRNDLLEQITNWKSTSRSSYLGEFDITYYDLSYASCGKNPGDQAYAHTYSGAIATEGVTVAVDKDVIPLGTYLYIDGIGYRVAQDIGGGIKGNRIDVFVNHFTYNNPKQITGRYQVYAMH